ncbi:MAG: TIGR01620 family protein [Cypionkella sp.]|nr:TIGR01620 family protein [Cypionkella sp.]
MNDTQLRRFALMEMDAPEADPSLAAPVLDDAAPAIATLQAMAPRRRSPLARAAIWVFSTLFALILTTAAWNYVTALFAANTVLGWVAFGLVIAALSLVLIAAWGEALAYLRMARLDAIRTRAAMAEAANDLPAARAVLGEITRLYASRAEVSWGMARLRERAGEVLDADALLALCEAEVIAPLDRLALAEVEAAARQVATITAFVPLALADVAAVLFANIRLIRRLSQIYGGRSGSLGSLRLMRRVAGALLAAGGMALADDLIGSVAGGGVLAKLSRRFGEGVVNGALTARVGIAAMELCRPMPFVALPRPNTGATVSRALAGLFGGRAE